MRSVLCYGDSNTWGSVPGSEGQRYGPDVRWPKVMASHLGDDFEVFEAGLNGRTTTFDRLPRQYRSGRDLLVPTMETCSPLDLVIILLGTNDVSLPYLSVADITRGAGELVTIVRFSDGVGPDGTGAPKPLLVAPHVVGPLGAEDAALAPGAVERSRELVESLRALASRLDCEFFDVSAIVSPSETDPWHWDAASHRATGQALAEQVRQILA